MRPFLHDQPATRTLFGGGRLVELPNEADRLGLKRLLVLSTPEQAELGEEALRLLGARGAGLFTKARMHVPLATAEAARAEARRLEAGGTGGIGGGHTTGRR